MKTDIQDMEVEELFANVDPLRGRYILMEAFAETLKANSRFGTGRSNIGGDNCSLFEAFGANFHGAGMVLEGLPQDVNNPLFLFGLNNSFGAPPKPDI